MTQQVANTEFCGLGFWLGDFFFFFGGGGLLGGVGTFCFVLIKRAPGNGRQIWSPLDKSIETVKVRICRYTNRILWENECYFCGCLSLFVLKITQKNQEGTII